MPKVKMFNSPKPRKNCPTDPKPSPVSFLNMPWNLLCQAQNQITAIALIKFNIRIRNANVPGEFVISAHVDIKTIIGKSDTIKAITAIPQMLLFRMLNYTI